MANMLLVLCLFGTEQNFRGVVLSAGGSLFDEQNTLLRKQ
jgi:hypothetical protein